MTWHLSVLEQLVRFRPLSYTETQLHEKTLMYRTRLVYCVCCENCGPLYYSKGQFVIVTRVCALLNGRFQRQQLDASIHTFEAIQCHLLTKTLSFSLLLDQVTKTHQSTTTKTIILGFVFSYFFKYY